MPEKLKSELSGILAWAVEGCLAWQKIGLAPPAAILDAVKEYRQGEDIFKCWLSEKCILNQTSRSKASDLIHSFKCYSGWRNLSDKKFSSMLSNHGFEKTKSNGVLWIGISLDLEQLEPLTSFSEKSYRESYLESLLKSPPIVPTVPTSQPFDFG